MEPQQSVQPDPPDDDPDQDQDPDQPPPYPSPALLDSALSLVAQPLASAAARVAASHPIVFPLEDLNDFNVDFSWAAPEIDSAFLNDTEYLQLGDDPQPSPPPHPPLTSQPLPSVSTTATVAIPQSIPDSQPLPAVSLSAQTFPSIPTPQNDPPPIPRSRSSSLPRKPSRNRLPQQNVKQSPIPIAPRSLTDTKLALDRSSASPAPRSMQALSSLRDTPKLIPTPPRRTPDPAPDPAPAPALAPPPAPPPASHEKHPAQSPPTPFTRFPLAMSPHPMTPILNMYPLQHQQSIFHPSHSSRSPHGLNAPDSTPIHRPGVSEATELTNVPAVTVESTPAPSSHPTLPQHAPQQPFMSPPIRVMHQGMVPYDTNIMPFFQMAYAAATAGYPHGVVPPLPARSPDMPPSILNPYSSDRSTGVNPNSSPNSFAQPPGPGTMEQGTQQTSVANAKSSGGPVVVQKAGKQVFVAQQRAARLERHPVLGRLQLKSTAKPHVATSTGLESSYVAGTNMSGTDDQRKANLDPTQIATSSTKAGPSSATAGEAAQRQQKKRLVWTQELHERFVKAIGAVGLNNAVPKTIVTIMNVDGLTTEHVKSHLQKYRNSMRKEAAEEERDRGRGAERSRDLRPHKFGTPSSSGAPGIQATTLMKPPGDANRSSQVGAVPSNPGRNHTLSFLPSRMNVLGGQVREILQPGVHTGLPKEITNSASTPKPETNSAREVLPPPSPKSPSTKGHPCHKAGSSDVVPIVDAKQWKTAASVTQEKRQNDAIKGSTLESPIENADPEENIDTTKATMSCKNTAPTDGSDRQGLPTAAVVDATEQAQRTSAIKHFTNTGADVSPLQNNRSGTNVQTDDRHKIVTAVAKARVENASSASQSNRDLELELMKEETQQMQLQVQMMVYRTIALEKRLEEIHSGRLNAEVSGGVDSSKRSTGGDATLAVVRTEGKKTRGDEVHKSEGAEKAQQTENAIVQKEKEDLAEGDSQKHSEVRTKKRPRSFASEGQTEVEALLGEQMGLQKRLENASALIDKRMKIDGDHDFVNQKRGHEQDDASPSTDMIDENDGNQDKGRVDPEVTSGQGRGSRCS